MNCDLSMGSGLNRQVGSAAGEGGFGMGRECWASRGWGFGALIVECLMNVEVSQDLGFTRFDPFLNASGHLTVPCEI